MKVKHLHNREISKRLAQRSDTSAKTWRLYSASGWRPAFAWWQTWQFKLRVQKICRCGSGTNCMCADTPTALLCPLCPLSHSIQSPDPTCQTRRTHHKVGLAGTREVNRERTIDRNIWMMAKMTIQAESPKDLQVWVWYPLQVCW